MTVTVLELLSNEWHHAYTLCETRHDVVWEVQKETASPVSECWSLKCILEASPAKAHFGDTWRGSLS